MTQPFPTLFEAEVAPGLEQITASEIRHRLPGAKKLQIQEGGIQFTFEGSLEALNVLRTAVAVYVLIHFALPRPKALLGHQHFHRIVDTIKHITDTAPQPFTTLHLSAAGSHTAVMTRIKKELAEHSDLHPAETEGDMLVRIRRTHDGWDVLLRLTPRPLSARSWRICDFEGALNAPTARAMIRLMNTQSATRCLNLACGSGTLLIEAAHENPTLDLCGCDFDLNVLHCAKQNLAAAALEKRVTLVQTDIRSLPFPDPSVGALCADLPFGQRVGSHDDNIDLYPTALKEAARVAKPSARLALITHEVRLMESILEQQPDWCADQIIRVALRGLHPRIYILRKC